MNRKGFSLIELLVVVAIIGIISAIGMVAYTGYTSMAKRNATQSTHSNVVKYINGWRGNCLNIQGVADRAKTAIVSCAACVKENIAYVQGMEQEYLGVCNMPLTNLNWAFAGYFASNGSTNPNNNKESGVDAKECNHEENCFDNANHIGVTYINVTGQKKLAPNLWSGFFEIKTFYDQNSDPLLSLVPWDNSE